jgi:acetyltransferase-like isoleucine patch superfamily enzyme
LLPFVRIGDGCLVGAGSVVTHDLPPGTVAFGNPARARGSVEDLLEIGERVVPDPNSAARFIAREG